MNIVVKLAVRKWKQFDLWIINFHIKSNFHVRLTKLSDISLNVEMYKM